MHVCKVQQELRWSSSQRISCFFRFLYSQLASATVFLGRYLDPFKSFWFCYNSRFFSILPLPPPPHTLSSKFWTVVNFHSCELIKIFLNSLLIQTIWICRLLWPVWRGKTNNQLMQLWVDFAIQKSSTIRHFGRTSWRRMKQ